MCAYADDRQISLIFHELLKGKEVFFSVLYAHTMTHICFELVFLTYKVNTAQGHRCINMMGNVLI